MNAAKPLVNRTQRLFLALWPDDEVRPQLADHAGQWSWPAGCVQVLPSDWHVTLHFIGQVASDRVTAIAAKLELPLQPFDLVLDQPRLWPTGLAVLCASQVPSHLLDLHNRLGDTLRGLGLPVEARQYQPHVTLARRADTATPPLRPLQVQWRVSAYGLIVSTGNTDKRYRVIRRYE